MTPFFLEKQVVKIGDTVSILGSCISGSTQFGSDDPNVATVIGTGIYATSIGTANIAETSMDCSNTGAIQLTVTEDGKPFFMSREDFLQYNEFEVVFIFGLLFVGFLIRFAKRS